MTVPGLFIYNLHVEQQFLRKVKIVLPLAILKNTFMWEMNFYTLKSKFFCSILQTDSYTMEKLDAYTLSL